LAELAKLLGCVVVEPTPTVSRPVAIVHRKAPLTPAAQRFVELATWNEKEMADERCG
jgi:hypothetical protein